MLAEEGFVHQVDGQWQWTQDSYPADAVSLRSITSDNFVVVDVTDGERVIGETDFTSGPSTLHEKAIYIVEGRAVSGGAARLRRPQGVRAAVECDYYTDAITYTKVTILDTFAATSARHDAEDTSRRGIQEATQALETASLAAPLANASAHGEVHVVSRVVGFKKIKFYTNENVGSGELDLPEQQMHTTSYWLTIPQQVMTALPLWRRPTAVTA